MNLSFYCRPLCMIAGLLLSVGATGQVSFERILNAADEPHNWLTYNGGYSSQRYSKLKQVTRRNVGKLELKWVLQNQIFGAWQSNPIVVDGIMYLTERHNDVMAVDAVTGRVFWMYRHTPAANTQVCCGANNRGVAILGDKVFMGTLDGRLIALDRINGKPLWNVEVGDVNRAYSVTMAPLAVKDKVIVGVGGGEYGIRGYVVAYYADTGKEAWKFYTIPGPGEPGHDSWEGDDWKHGGAPVWITGSFDPELNLTYWGVGNPGPDWNAEQRPGDNLYSDSAIALDVDTGELKWHFQFTPNDDYDYDSVQVPVLIDRDWQGKPAKLMMWANRNGYIYVLDRVTGKFLLGKPFTKVNWSSGLDENGRPIPTPQPEGMPTYPGNQGGTNWYPPSYSPRTDLFYFSAWENYATIYQRINQEYEPGGLFLGGGFVVKAPVHGAPTIAIGRTSPINNWTDEVGHASLMAMDPDTGKAVWKYEQFDVSDSGMLTTASDLLFTGGREGYLHALDARNGKLLWKVSLGGQIVMAPVTYMVDGVQYVTVISGNMMSTFALGR
ncbi:MAG TPA: PQQ-dependent dehydrogenase, methanol/ethanol family [Pseudomonadales bacterium]|nr:PQQ-dependent dehydrogenase, methanol/ethanol family [Gammaproteobacteria bacterium]MDP6025777.1 PQQ-dependent dehydrogenase, methanol/ethanol family [Pseudomonadales bacterium]MDP6314892.1 PQQ-dependent dehydrogenase, methanol/ethanol family [Pseudomonadales bacterium]MDP7316538.1 PQQ-dependent dehydrogenase, methanol/ethanol family [Pseudomonadales bacterium]HJP49713.1 PQQ-dependent dehydrogenase, methanol/ethanol family [Pseudomonadales bacterium]